MERICVIAVGGMIGTAAVVYMVKLLILRIFGVKTAAEVVAVKEPEQGKYIHTVRFVHNGKTVEHDDKTGYSQPFSKGERLEIICSKRISEKFEYTTALNKHIVISAVLVLMSILIILRFMFGVTE